jgi:transposase
MLSQAQRTTILELHRQGVAKREIARVLGISRVAVRKVLRSNSTAIPELPRPEKAEPYRPQILELFDRCQGNLVRVHEELRAGGAIRKALRRDLQTESWKARFSSDDNGFSAIREYPGGVA